MNTTRTTVNGFSGLLLAAAAPLIDGAPSARSPSALSVSGRPTHSCRGVRHHADHPRHTSRLAAPQEAPPSNAPEHARLHLQQDSAGCTTQSGSAKRRHHYAAHFRQASCCIAADCRLIAAREGQIGTTTNSSRDDRFPLRSGARLASAMAKKDSPESTEPGYRNATVAIVSSAVRRDASCLSLEQLAPSAGSTAPTHGDKRESFLPGRAV